MSQVLRFRTLDAEVLDAKQNSYIGCQCDQIAAASWSGNTDNQLSPNIRINVINVVIECESRRIPQVHKYVTTAG